MILLNSPKKKEKKLLSKMSRMSGMLSEKKKQVLKFNTII